MSNPVGHPTGAVDPMFIPAHSGITLGVRSPAFRCRCREPHHGHEPKNLVTSMIKASLIGDPSDDSIATILQPPASVATVSIPPSTQSAPLSDTQWKQPSPNNPIGTPRDRRKEKVGVEIKALREELCSHCFLSSFLPAFDDGAYEEKVASLPLLKADKFELTSPSPTSSSTRETWPVDSNERAHYSHFTSISNEIIDHFKEIINPDNSKTVRFITYDKPMAPVTPSSLKPDLFLVEEKFAGLNSLQWKHPILPIEVKRDFWDALKQIGTYVREMLSARPGRQVCWALYFDHLKSASRVVLFTPDRVHYTKPTVITSAEGYRDMVKLVVALLSQPNLLTIGEDRSRDSSTKLLPNGDRLEIRGTEFDRKSVVGRRTRVLLVMVVGKDGRGVGQKISEHGESTANVVADYILTEIQENPDENLTFADNSVRLKSGESLVIKESWPLESHQNIEWDALKSCSGEFGVPAVVYRVTGKHPMRTECTTEPRVPQHIAFREKGLPLQVSASPRLLLTAVLHAVIGHWNLFQKGWLHRDVSIGNVLILSEPGMKSPPTGLEGFEDLTECHGMLIDGDGMIHSSSDRKLGDHRSCTLPFLSRRLVRSWKYGIKTFDQYFDDLEAFAWVLLWALLDIAEVNNKTTTIDQTLTEYLNGNDLASLMAGKATIVAEFKRLSVHVAQGSKGDSTSLLDPFIIILDHWFGLIDTKDLCGNVGTLPSNEESTEFYQNFITFAMDKLEDLPEEWNL